MYALFNVRYLAPTGNFTRHPKSDMSNKHLNEPMPVRLEKLPSLTQGGCSGMAATGL